MDTHGQPEDDRQPDDGGSVIQNLDTRDIRRVDLVARSEAGTPIVIMVFNVGLRDGECFDIKVDQDLEPWDFIGSVATRLDPAKRRVTMSGPLLSSEVWAGPAVADVVMCRWSSAEDRFVPIAGGTGFGMSDYKAPDTQTADNKITY